MLRAESELRHISLNSMINQILQRWDMYASRVGLMSFLKPVAAELFKRKSKQEIIELATNIGKNATNDAGPGFVLVVVRCAYEELIC